MPTYLKGVFNFNHVNEMLAAVHNLFERTAELYNPHDNQPAPGSIAFREWNSFQNQQLIIDVYYRALFSMESAADHLISFANLYVEPATTLAPWTCIRGLLESSAIGLWFLDPTIDAKTRVARCFAFRYEGLCQQIKFCRAEKLHSYISNIQKRIVEVEQEAVDLGFEKKASPNGSINGIAMAWPGITELIKTTLNFEGAYRLFSEISHGHQWAIAKISYQEYTTAKSNIPHSYSFEKRVRPETIMYTGMVAIPAFSKLLWNIWYVYGWDRSEIEDCLNQVYDQAHLKNNMKLWRSK